jgi:transposase InsO family protein
MDEKLREQIALFRYGVIADLVHHPPGERGLYPLLKEKAGREYQIPGSRRRHVAEETMRDWLAAYRRGGFDALFPKPRSDQGHSRAIPQSLADLLCTIKEETPALSVAQVIEQALARPEVALPEGVLLAPATVHRLLSRHHLTGRTTSISAAGKDRRRFAFEKANELWMSDVMHGPAVFGEGRRKRKSYLIALLDDATRVVPYAAFAFAESTAAFLPVFKQALLRRGIPKRLYVDNGALYRSTQLALVCAKLGITLIHARPYLPQGKGKQERWFRTVRMQLLPTLGEADLKSLDALNRRLWAWVEAEYHHHPHRGLDDETPLDRWAMSAEEVRLLGPECDLDEICLFELKRRVQKDRTVSLLGVVYEVEAQLVGQTVTLRYDPSRPGRKIDVYFGGKKVQQAKPVDAYANCFVRRDHDTKILKPQTPPKTPPAGLKLADLRKRDEER